MIGVIHFTAFNYIYIHFTALIMILLRLVRVDGIYETGLFILLQ
jgi:hypothetical protein